MTAPHPVAYPLMVGNTWRATCACHWMQPLTATQPLAGAR